MISAGVTMNGLLRKLDVIANNVANAGTVGFKRKEATFEDVLNAVKNQHPDKQLPGRLTPPGLTIAAGAKLGRIQTVMQQGSLLQTERPWDVAIEGEGLFEVGLPVPDEDGEIVYERAWTRNGAFQLSIVPDDPEQLMLTTAEGYPVMSMDDEPVLVPAGSRVSIEPTGLLLAYAEDDPAAEPEEIGQLKLVRAVRPQLLENRGENLFVLPVADPDLVDELMEELDLVMADPADPAGTRLRQGYLENSNVDLAQELTELIQVQRAFQLNARALASSDTMMNLANTLRS